MNDFKNAKWIACKDSMEIEPAPMFRKRIKISKHIKTAKLYACGLGHGVYFLNGKKVTNDVLLTPISKYDTRVYYDVYNVTHMLDIGDNAIGCILGNGWYLVTYHRWDRYKPAWMHHPKLILRLCIEYEDNTYENIVSDSTWKVHDSAIIYNENKRGEIYDARQEIVCWNMPDYDDSYWSNAFICRGPGGILEKNYIPPIRVTEKLTAIKLSDNVYDIGQNISGWLGISVTGERGAGVTIEYAERLHDDGTIAPELLNTIEGSDTHRDKYILKGDGIEKYTPSFAYHGFRYVSVKIDGKAQVIDAFAEVVHTDLDCLGNFECSNEMLNNIHSATRWATLTNMHGIPTDCPQREQNGWTGDALLSCEQTLMNFDAKNLYKKWLTDVCDTQRPSGQISCIAPTGGWGYNWGSGPAWDSALVLIPYYVYQNTGSKELIEKFWNNMTRYMEFMETMSENNEVCYGLGDWLAPDGTKVCETVITDTAYFYFDNYIMSKCARLIGKDGLAFAKRAKEIKTDFISKFSNKLGDNMTALACCVYFGLANDKDIPKIAEKLSNVLKNNDYHIQCGVLGTKYIFSALSMYGYAEDVYKMVTNPTYPSYAYWINNGMTTLCERWDMTDSLNHHMFSEVDMWLYREVAGFKLCGGKLTIEPKRLKSVAWVKASFKEVSIEFDNEKICINTDKSVELIWNDTKYILEKGEHIILK